MAVEMFFAAVPRKSWDRSHKHRLSQNLLCSIKGSHLVGSLLHSGDMKKHQRCDE